MALSCSYNKQQQPLNPMAKPYHKIHHPTYYYPYHHPSLVSYHQLPVFIPTHDFFQNVSTKTNSASSHHVINKWVSKSKKKKLEKHEADVMIKKRWKNRRSEYHKILPLETGTTCLMIKNIPNKYTRKLMIHTLDHHCHTENKKNKDFVSSYDFLYLPIDFNWRFNAGFAFVNFTDPRAALRFSQEFNGKGWGFFDSSKVAQISRARIQGKEALKSNFRKVDFSYGSEEDMPVLFEPARDGSGRVCSRMYTLAFGDRWRSMVVSIGDGSQLFPERLDDCCKNVDVKCNSKLCSIKKVDIY